MSNSSDKPPILVVDDEESVRKVFQDTYEEKYEINTCSRASDALDYLESGKTPQLIITDVKMPEMDGLELLEKLQEDYSQIPVILITGYATVDMAVEAMKTGAFDFVVKPFDFDELENQIDRALEVAEIQHQLEISYPDLRLEDPDEKIVAASEDLEGIIKIVKKISDYKTNVLITGETGTGKELIAQALHYNGKFKDKPFVVINCAALPDNLLESELFGYRKGAFTDAQFDKKGKAKVADGGTLFLDEISAISEKVQAKLLRLIQENELQPLGAEETENVDVRVIAATNEDLEKEVEASRFREDLYFRLNIVPIHLPPLRERKEEIIPLARYFLKKINQEYDFDKELTSSALEKLSEYDWPGNIRELENCIERSALISEGTVIDADQFNFGSDDAEAEKKAFKTLEEVEKEQLKKALQVADGDKAQASDLLGIHRSTLYRKLEKANIDE